MEKKRFKENPLKRKYGHHVHSKKPQISVNSLKKKLRDTQRLLKKCLDAKKRVELERLVETLELEIKESEAEKKYCKYEEKYKYVKFVELKKTKRRLKKCTEQEKEQFKLYENYILYYPRDCKYISLYKTLEPESKPYKRQQEIFNRLKEFSEQGKLKDGFTWMFKKQDLDSSDSESDGEVEEPQEDDFFL